MTRDEIIRMAIEAGLHDEMWFGPHTPTNYENCLPKIERFANLVAAKEREACAQIAFNSATYIEAAKAIRERGE